MDSLLRNDAKLVLEALAALAAHDKRTDEMLAGSPGTYTAEEWAEREPTRRGLSVVLEERSGLLARLVLSVTP